jgi:Xaa-Pro aminopeptidase
MRTEQRLQKSEAETQRLQNEVTYQTNTAAAALGGLDRYEQRLQKSEAEVDRLRAALESADGVIRAVQDALGVEADTDAVIAAKKAAAEVARLQGSVDRVRALSASDAWSAYDEDLGSIQVMAADDVLAILDGEAQS